MMAEKETLRVAGVADVHAKKTAAGTFQAMGSSPRSMFSATPGVAPSSEYGLCVISDPRPSGPTS